MARSKKFDYQALVENELSQEPAGISLDELLQRCKLKVDRSTLFRHLARLIETGRVERIGKARASRYRLLHLAPAPTEPAPAPGIPTAHQAPRYESPLLAASATPQPPQSARTEPHRAPPPTPDYGMAVIKGVRTVVRDWKRRNEVNLRIYLSLLVKREQIEGAAAAVELALAGLHEGNLDRYGLTPAEFRQFIASENGQTALG